MKKTVFGYSQKEVSETIDNLTNQNTALIQRNDRLEDDLKELKIQLEESKVANEGLLSRAECSDYENIKKNFGSLVKDNSQLKDDNTQLRSEVDQLKNEIDQLKVQLANAQTKIEELEQEAEIVISDAEVNDCLDALKQACSKSYNAKGRIGRSMQEAIDEYVNQWVTADDDFRLMTEKAEETRQNAKKNFVNSAKKMLSAFEQIDECNKLKL